MVTSVKLSEQSKKVLDALQAEVTLKSGSKISQQELLELLLADAEQSKEELISKIAERPKVPLSYKEIKNSKPAERLRSGNARRRH